MTGFELRQIDLRRASDAEYAGLNALRNAIRLEELPEDPPWPCEEDRRRFQAMNALKDNTAWVARDDNARLVALGQADIFLTSDNPRLMWFNIEVLADVRRQGIGRRMLALIADHARSRQRPLLTVDCNDRQPGGLAFLQRIGAAQGLLEAINQLAVSGLDRSLVQAWLQQSAALKNDFELGSWGSPYPADRLQDVADLLQEVANDQPRGSLDMEDIEYSPALVRGFDDEGRAGGDIRWTLYAAARRDGKLAGITEVYWNPNRPHLLWQGFTGVMPAYRSRGLGRWLKAEMLRRVLRERPQVQVIRVGNADSNAPMLKLNLALGFRPHVAWSTWQVELDALETYLRSTR